MTAFLTAYYMGREVFVVFLGKPRDQHAYDHAHESPLVMTLPLIFLAALSIIAGLVQTKSPISSGRPTRAGCHSLLLTDGLIAVPLFGFLVCGE